MTWPVFFKVKEKSDVFPLRLNMPARWEEEEKRRNVRSL